MTASPLAARIAELERLLDGTAITTLVLTEGGETLVLRRDAPPEPAREAAPELLVAAPGPGVFLPCHPLRADPLAVPGQAVAAGAVLGLLRAGPLLLSVTAPQAGILLAVAAAAGDLVGYGTPLFRLAPDGASDLGEDP